jgi:ATP-dependent DNA helicase PIF1
MILTRLGPHILEVRLLSGTHAGQLAFIPRITLTSNELAVNLQRRQFPTRLAFAMTINKSQGQSVHYVGIDLHNPIFTHGQLYVALSRSTSAARIKVLLLPGQEALSTKNIVYKEVLLL